MSGPLPLALLPTTARGAESGRLSIGGVDLVDLAAEVGTPAFVYDEEELRARCREAVAAWPGGVAYASKAFLCTAMARLVAEEGMGIDVATGGELHIALHAGVPAERIVLHGNNKSDAELATALEVGVGRIVVDSFDEIDRLAKLDARCAVLLRVTPGVEAHTHEYVMTGQEDSKFGFSIASGAATEALARLGHLDTRFVGVHAHIGSQIFLLHSFEKEIEALTNFVAPLSIEELNVGGGLGVAYVEGEVAPTITEWAATVEGACREAGLAGAVKLTAEPGRSIAATAGVTLYTVGTIKTLPGIRTYVSVDGGMSDNPRPVLYGSGYETFLPRAVGAERPVAATLVGKHCESGDLLVRDARLPADVAVGDILATPVTGAYGHSMASNYNLVPRAAAVIVENGRSVLATRRESVSDLFAREL
jgi:diaminopimelate decarboxylase